MDMIRDNPDRFTMYYGASDAWAPLHHHEHMSKHVGEPIGHNRVYLCSKDIPHAFVVSHSEEMSTIMSDWLKEK
jgi:hypothetical protein